MYSGLNIPSHCFFINSKISETLSPRPHLLPLIETFFLLFYKAFLPLLSMYLLGNAFHHWIFHVADTKSSKESSIQFYFLIYSDKQQKNWRKPKNKNFGRNLGGFIGSKWRFEGWSGGEEDENAIPMIPPHLFKEKPRQLKL